MGVIYKTTNLINNKIYIGQDKNNNPAYIGSGTYIKRSIEKYGRENFIKEILEHCDDIELNDKEIYWISYYNSTDPVIGYNLTSGGKQATEYTLEVRQKMSDSKKGSVPWNKGLKVSENTLKKMIESKKNISVESRKKMSESRKGKSAWNKGVKTGPRRKEEQFKINLVTTI